MSKQKAIVLLSGGMDSTTLLYHLVAEGWEVEALSILYGQRHARELDFAKRLCERGQVTHTVCDLGVLSKVLGGSSQTDSTIPVPSGHYADPVMRITVVPNRNMILLAVAAAKAISVGCATVAYAAHVGDHAVYPDCRPEFILALQGALNLCHYDGGVNLLAPFSQMSKADIVKRGRQLHVPYYLTYSCYTGKEKSCGICGTCVERLQAFWAAGAEDPIQYEDRAYARTINP